MVASGESLLKDMNEVAVTGFSPEASSLTAPQTNEEPKKKGAFQITNVRQGQEARDTSFGDTTLLEEDDEDDEVANEEETSGQEGQVGIQSNDSGAHGAQNDLADVEGKPKRFRVVKLQGNLVKEQRGRWRCNDCGGEVLERNSSNGSPSADSTPVTAEQSPVVLRKGEQHTSSPPAATSTPAQSVITRGHGSELHVRLEGESSTGSTVKDDVFELRRDSPRSLSRQVSVEESRDSGASSPALEGSTLDAEQVGLRSVEETAPPYEPVSDTARLHPVCSPPEQATMMTVMMGQVQHLLSHYVIEQTGQLKDKNKQLEDQIDQLRVQLHSLEDDNKLLQKENCSLKEEKTFLWQENTNLRDKNDSLRQELGSLKGREPIQ